MRERQLAVSPLSIISKQAENACRGAEGGGRLRDIFLDAGFFLLKVGSFLLTVELFYLQLTNFAFLLAVGACLLTALAFYLQLELFCLQWESASNKGLKGL